MTFPALTSHRRSENICIIIECNCGISKFKKYRPTVLLYLQTLNSVGSVAPMRPLSPPPFMGPAFHQVNLVQCNLERVRCTQWQATCDTS